MPDHIARFLLSNTEHQTSMVDGPFDRPLSRNIHPTVIRVFRSTSSI